MLAQDRGQVGLGHVVSEGAVLEDELGANGLVLCKRLAMAS